MLVKDLIKSSEFIASENFYKKKPKVSVLLPTYRRNKSGFLRKAIDSILNQTFTNFELIIIDDASTDGTFEVIKNYIKNDNRVACIRHIKNIGFPAISIFEGYQHSRSKKIFFVFDDNELVNIAIEESYNYQIENNVFVTNAQVNLILEKGRSSVILGVDEAQSYLLCNYNYIPNSALMIDKEVIENIGWYDPHICMKRLCDWDLLLRITKKYKIHSLKKILSTERGASLSDSLGNTLPLDMQLTREWMSTSRNNHLLPKNYLNYNIFEIRNDLSQKSALEISELTNKKLFSKKKYQFGLSYILIVGDYYASASLYYENLKKEFKIIFITDLENIFKYEISTILNAKLVIFCRSVLNYKYAFILKRAKIPYYYYTDDNLIELEFESLTPQSIYFLKNCEGYIFSNNKLSSFFNNISDKKTYFVNPIFNALLINSDKDQFQHFTKYKTIKLAFFSIDREDSYCEIINTLSQNKKYKFTIYTTLQHKVYFSIYNFKNIEFVYFNKQLDYNHFILMIKNLEIHFFIHPLEKKYEINYKNKTLNMLFNSCYTNSLIIMDDVAPYNYFNQGSCKNLFLSNNNNINDIIDYYMHDISKVKECYNVILDHIKKNYSSVNNEKVIQTLHDNHKNVSLDEYFKRVKRLGIKKEYKNNESLIIFSNTVNKAAKKFFRKNLNFKMYSLYLKLITLIKKYFKK